MVPKQPAPAVSRAQVTCLVLQDSTKYILLLECAYTFRVLDIFNLLWYFQVGVYGNVSLFDFFLRVKNYLKLKCLSINPSFDPSFKELKKTFSIFDSLSCNLVFFCIIVGFHNEKMINTKSRKCFSLERSGKLRPSMDLVLYGLVTRHNGGLRKGQLISKCSFGIFKSPKKPSLKREVKSKK